jgi:antiviral helicase SKI2
MKARGKKDDEADFFGKSKKKATSDGQGAEEELMEFLIDAEKTDSSWNPLDLRDCVKQGNDILDFRKYCGHMEELWMRVRSFRSHFHPSIEGHYAALERKESLRSRMETLRHLLSNESLQLFPDFLQRKSVLKTLGYVDENETVCVKGRVACEVNTCEELIVTEMVFEGVLNDLEPAEIVAALSSLVYQAKSDDEFDAELPERLIGCCRRMKTIATNIGQLQKDHGLDIDPGEYCDGALKFGLVHVVYEWALGVMFSNICELTDAQEGTIVRCITRLDELCREVRNCARVVGNPTLYRKMEAASMAIKRDIVFASSLYVS